MLPLQVSGLCKRYPSFSLDHVSLNVEEGHIMGFIGRNGAGKSTTLKCLLNFVHPDAGEIRFFGNSFEKDEWNIKQKLGFLNGGVDYYLHRKIRKITEVTQRFYPSWNKNLYERYMTRFHLDENKTPAQLSAGMRVKYNLALALSHEAKLFILDEPTSGLDPISRDELLEIFLNLASQGMSILFSTHITSDLERCADDITYIRKGSIIKSTSLKGFQSEYALLHLEDESSVPATLQSRLIGKKAAKQGYTALISRKDSAQWNLPLQEATLEEIMIHLEREGEMQND